MYVCEAGAGDKVLSPWGVAVKSMSFGSRHTLPLNQLGELGFRFCTVKWDHCEALKYLQWLLLSHKFFKANPLESIKLHCPYSGF